jgi:hypothetical protein
MFFLLGCLAQEDSTKYPQNKVGTWCESYDDGNTCYGYTTYFADGTAENFAQYPEQGFGVNAKAIWWHEGKQSCFKLTDVYMYRLDTREELEPVTLEPWCNEVVELGKYKFTYLKEDNTKRTIYRSSRY